VVAGLAGRGAEGGSRRYALERRRPGSRTAVGTFGTPEAAWRGRRAAGLGPPGKYLKRVRRSVTGGPAALPAAVVTRPRTDRRGRSRPADPTAHRRRIAAYLAEHGPTPGDRLAAALGLQLDQFWPLINYRWFDVVTGGWGLTARGRAEGLGGGRAGRRTAVGACMRKLVMIAYGVLKNRAPFDPNWSSRITT
jgi:hypothetical protein